MKRFLASIAIIALTFPWPTQAAQLVFDANRVLSDADLTDTAVSEEFVQRFIASKGGAIAGMKFMDLDGTMKSPGAIITYYGRVFGVNPRYLLALIQKEQSLVTSPNPSVCQIDWATGYGRPDGSTCNDPQWQKYRGFASQIISAAAFVQCFYAESSGNCGSLRSFGFFAGREASIDGTTVIPANTATAMLYTYTPHLHGNRLLLGIWNEWFGAGEGIHPDGSYLSAPDGSVYLITDGAKRKFASAGALRSRVDPTRVIPVEADILAGYPSGADIRFSEYSLIRVPDGTIYLLSGDVKRPIASMEVFRSIGFNPEEVDDATAADLAPYREGTLITIESSYPTGALLQDDATGGVYFVETGVKYPIYSAEIMRATHPGKKISPVSKSILDRLPTGAPVKFREGELVMGPGSNVVYVISNGQRRPIASEEAFLRRGYAWNRIIATNQAALGVHPLGAFLN